MSYAETLRERLKQKRKLPEDRDIKRLSILEPDAPAPSVQAVIEKRGPDTFKESLDIWQQRVNGTPIVDVAHNHGISIETAKALIKEAHDAVASDLKETLSINRELDLHRLDSLIQAWYPDAKRGDEKAANVVLKCIQQRSRLVGSEALPPPGDQKPVNILLWINNQLPNIGRLVDELPAE